MKNIKIFLLALVLLIIAVFFAKGFFISKDSSPKNIKYTIDNQEVTLVNGVSEVSIPNSSSKVTTKYFGNEVTKDLDGDGREDKAFLVTQETGGSGVFYYVVAALNKEDGYVGGKGLFLGDRISPQSTVAGDGRTIVVNYADRKVGEDFSVSPSVGKSIILLFSADSMDFGEVVKDFEGEANPSSMKLNMKKWIWINALYNDGKEVTPKQAGKFSLTFESNKFTATTDCNQMGGEYSTNGSEITFKNIYSTKMFCEDSQESDFAKLLENTSSYHFTSKGELVLDLKFDSGSVVFK